MRMLWTPPELVCIGYGGNDYGMDTTRVIFPVGHEAVRSRTFPSENPD